MISAGLLTAWQFVKNLPWQLWLVLAVIATGWFYGNARYNDGVAEERARWEAKVQEAKDRAKDADVGAADQRAKDAERNDDASDARKDAIRDNGRTGLNCERLRRAYPNRPLPAACGH